MSVGDAKQHPDLVGSVASVDTRDFWHEIEESPRSQNYHYHRNPETYMLVGEAIGRAMVHTRFRYEKGWLEKQRSDWPLRLVAHSRQFKV